MAGGDDTLKGSTQMWNYLEEGLLEWRLPAFKALRDSGLKTARAWQIKECLRHLWDMCTDRGQAEDFFAEWSPPSGRRRRCSRGTWGASSPTSTTGSPTRWPRVSTARSSP